jgi:D-sedoheptulose 7-phosphate isomerase
MERKVVRPMAADIVRKRLGELADLLNTVAGLFDRELEILALEVVQVLESGGKLLFCGNGGSAADAQHLAAEYVVRFGRDRNALPAIALTTDTSVLTACANDFGFEAVFSRQIEALAAPGDFLFLHSTSGNSENLVQAAETAASLGVRTVGFLARDGGRLAGLLDRAIVIPTNSTARAQELHLTLGHILCEMVEDRLVGPGSGADQ